MDIQTIGSHFFELYSIRRADIFHVQAKNAVVIGHGNVGLDVTRMLLKNVDELMKTDMTKFAIDNLKSSSVRTVHLIGRRGISQASFTTGELREVLSIPYVYFLK